MLEGFAVKGPSLNIVSVTVMSDQLTSVGCSVMLLGQAVLVGVQVGEAGRLRVSVPWLWPFDTLKVPEASCDEVLVDLLAALGQLPPLFTQLQITVSSASAEMLTEFKLLPSPAS